jgi:hypothetical protein
MALSIAAVTAGPAAGLIKVTAVARTIGGALRSFTRAASAASAPGTLFRPAAMVGAYEARCAAAGPYHRRTAAAAQAAGLSW